VPKQNRFCHLSLSAQSPVTASAGVMRGIFQEEPFSRPQQPQKSPDGQWLCKIKLEATDLHGWKLRRPSGQRPLISEGTPLPPPGFIDAWAVRW
jgi:hypothetical protein